MSEKIEKAVYTTVEVVCSSCRPVLVPGRIEKAVLTTVGVL